MSFIDNWTECFEVITPHGEAYGKIMAVLTKPHLPFLKQNQETPYYSLTAHSSEKIQEYDILRRKEDGKTFRIISINKDLLENGFIGANCQPYEIWDN